VAFLQVLGPQSAAMRGCNAASSCSRGQCGVTKARHDLVALGDTVNCCRFVGLQVTQYSHGSIDLLGIQIDAAINGGNSGGPVFNKRGQCCGIAFQVCASCLWASSSYSYMC
jgi:hypothetical protein